MEPTSFNTGKPGDIPKLNFFKQETFKTGNIEKEVEKAVSLPEDKFQSGKWKAAYNQGDIEKYKQTLGGKPVENFDPKGFLKELGLPEDLKSPGRTDSQMYKAFTLVDYKPDPQYFPGPKWLSGPVQNALVKLGKKAPDFASKVDKLATNTVIKKLESADTKDPNPYGKESDIDKGKNSGVSNQERYQGISSQNTEQFAWDSGIHSGSIKQSHGNEKFGTYDIALKMGFTEEQATNIAAEDFGVDDNKTHYHDPKDPSKTRITHSGTGGDNGDLGWHYNRSKDGEEDTRITAAKVHFERALKLAGEGYHDAAEKELGVGLHSLQDIFSHGQITPINHIVVGEFPDFVKWNPVGMYETALATEAYLKKFVEKLNLKAPDESVSPSVESKPLKNYFNQIPGVEPQKQKAIGNMVKGNATTVQKLQLATKLNTYPKDLLDMLDKNKVNIFLAKDGTKPTDLGFGKDLDKDGKITPEKWMDINKDGKKQNSEVEGKMNDGRNWNEQSAAYNNKTKTIFLSSLLLNNDKGLDDKLKHEIDHSVDFAIQNDPKLGDSWKKYINKMYEGARRSGEIDFNSLEPHEYFAEKPAE